MSVNTTASKSLHAVGATGFEGVRFVRQGWDSSCRCRFLIKGIAPGGYKLFAWEDIIDGEYEDPEFMKSNEALGQHLEISERSHDSAQLKLIPAEKTGKVTGN